VLLHQDLPARDGDAFSERVEVVRERLLPAGGIFDGPFGSNLKSSDYTESGARVVRLENIGHLRFIGSKQSFVSDAKYASLPKHAVYPGDIVFSSFVEERIRVCALPDDLDEKALAKADCFTLRPTEVVDRRYLAMQMASPRSYGFLVSDVHGATRPRVNTTQVRSLPVALCTPAEQQEIIHRFDALMHIADETLARIDVAAHSVERSSQAVLAKAFRGELVTSSHGGSNE
jgi:type I restriction enzyme, S subunit